jgi:glycosyltransferase involved in cell wall biosynthesis
MGQPSRLTICFPFTGDTVGGSHISVLGLLNGLDREQFRIIVAPQVQGGAIARLFTGQEIVRSPEENRPALPAAGRIGPGRALRAMSGLRSKIRFLISHRVDIVHTNDGRTHASWALAAKLSGARLVWHHRGDPGARGLRLLAPLLADRVLAVSSFALPPDGFWSAARKSEVLHSPFDTSVRADRNAMRAALLQETGFPPETLLLGYFGSFIHRKRPLAFIDAIASARAQRPSRPVAGLMFGLPEEPGMEAAMSRRILDANLGGFVRCMGYRSPGAEWIAACDQLVVPAVGEPFGRTLIEAMLVRTPIVATRSGGNVEALRNGELGILVRPDDAAALAAACWELADDPARAHDYADQAHSDAMARFGQERHCARVAEIYTALTSRASVEKRASESRLVNTSSHARKIRSNA